MSRYRLEITLDEGQLAAVDAARGHEPRASFAKRALAAFVYRDPMTKLVQDGPGLTEEQLRGGFEVVMERPKPRREDVGEGTPLPKIAPRRQPR